MRSREGSRRSLVEFFNPGFGGVIKAAESKLLLQRGTTCLSRFAMSCEKPSGDDVVPTPLEIGYNCNQLSANEHPKITRN